MISLSGIYGSVTFTATEAVKSPLRTSDLDMFSHEYSIHEYLFEQGAPVPAPISFDKTTGTITMAKVEGTTLSELVGEFTTGNLELEYIQEVIHNCIEALSKLHQVGVLHGDPNLGNFIVGKNKSITLIDFGWSVKEKAFPSWIDIGPGMIDSPETDIQSFLDFISMCLPWKSKEEKHLRLKSFLASL